VLLAHTSDVRGKIVLHGSREHRHAVLVAFARAHHDLARSEVDVLHAQAAALQQSQPGAVEQIAHQPRGVGQALEDRAYLVPGQDDGQPFGSPRPHQVIHPRDVQLEDGPVQEQRALSAWFWVEAATFRSTASEVRKREISGPPISAGCRLPWKKMYRRIHAT
jgi:hypothetical protein